MDLPNLALNCGIFFHEVLFRWVCLSLKLMALTIASPALCSHTLFPQLDTGFDTCTVRDLSLEERGLKYHALFDVLTKSGCDPTTVPV